MHDTKLQEGMQEYLANKYGDGNAIQVLDCLAGGKKSIYRIFMETKLTRDAAGWIVTHLVGDNLVRIEPNTEGGKTKCFYSITDSGHALLGDLRRNG